MSQPGTVKNHDRVSTPEAPAICELHPFTGILKNKMLYNIYTLQILGVVRNPCMPPL